MTSMLSRSIGPERTLEPLRAKAGWIIALGAVYIVAGVIALGSVVTATVATVLVVGIMMVIAGVAEVINAFRSKLEVRFCFGSCWAGSISSRALLRSTTRSWLRPC